MALYMVKNKWNIEKKSLVFTLKSGYVEMIDTFVFRKNQIILKNTISKRRII